MKEFFKKVAKDIQVAMLTSGYNRVVPVKSKAIRK